LVWDAVEPLRPKLVKTVFEYAGERVFQKGDFGMFEGGVVRLTAEVAREVAGVVIRRFPLKEYIETVKAIERML
jgi:hypothetical protein